MVLKSEAEKILCTYQLAWENQDSDLILQIFHKDASYHEHAFKPKMVGHEEIKGYWDTKVKLQQANIDFCLLNYFIDDENLIAEWECEFDQMEKENRIRIREVAIIHVQLGKIRSLREYWATKLVKHKL